MRLLCTTEGEQALINPGREAAALDATWDRSSRRRAAVYGRFSQFNDGPRGRRLPAAGALGHRTVRPVDTQPPNGSVFRAGAGQTGISSEEVAANPGAFYGNDEESSSTESSSSGSDSDESDSDASSSEGSDSDESEESSADASSASDSDDSEEESSSSGEEEAKAPPPDRRPVRHVRGAFISAGDVERRHPAMPRLPASSRIA